MRVKKWTSLKLVAGNMFVYGYTEINRYVDSEYGNVESDRNLLLYTNMQQKSSYSYNVV